MVNRCRKERRKVGCGLNCINKENTMTEKELIKKWAELSSDTMSKAGHAEMAESYEALAKHYDDLAAEARQHAKAHRARA